MRLLCLALTALIFAAGCGKARLQRTQRPTLVIPPISVPALQPAQPAPLAPALPPAPPAQPEKAAVLAPATQPTTPTEKAWVVTGYGLTIEDAHNDALRRAVNEVHDYLKEYHPDLDRPLTPAYLTSSGIARFVGKEEPLQSPNVGQAWRVRVQLEMTPEQVTKLYDLARKDRMGPRHHLALLVLFGLCSALVVAMVYLRLETATRGYSTGLLRLVAATVLALTVAGVVALW
jgi:hypothetical protein